MNNNPVSYVRTSDRGAGKYGIEKRQVPNHMTIDKRNSGCVSGFIALLLVALSLYGFYVLVGLINTL